MVFRRLTRADVTEITRRELTAAAERAAGAGLRLTWDADAAAALAELGYDPDRGARALRRAVGQQVEDAAAEKLLRGALRRGDTARVRVRNGAVTVEKDADAPSLPSP